MLRFVYKKFLALARECVTEDDPFGLRYTGPMNTTMCGYPCQRWDSQTPMDHPYTASAFLTENLCRNPGDESRPWCYTTNPSKRWQLCARLGICGETIRNSKRDFYLDVYTFNLTREFKMLKICNQNSSNRK